MVECVKRYTLIMTESETTESQDTESEDREMLRNVLNTKTTDELVRNGFTYVEAKMIVERNDLNKKRKQELKDIEDQKESDFTHEDIQMIESILTKLKDKIVNKPTDESVETEPSA